MYCGFTLKLKRFSLSLALVLLSVTLFAQDELVGLTSNGGPEGGGTAFSINTNGAAFAVTKSFANWGSNAQGSLIRGNDGNLYGVAAEGGTYGHGTIFRISPSGTVRILKHLNMAVDGGYPKGTLLLAKDGNFYGTVSNGTVNNGGGIFKITPAGVYTVVRSLSVNTDGGRPNGRLIQGADNNFYGVNYAGGTYGYGTIFKLTTAGAYTVLKHFNYKPDGGNSYGSVIQAKDGNLYGMTYWGGTNQYGVIYKITTAGVYTVLRHFAHATDGGYPRGDLVQGTDGFLYGLTYSGGTGYNGTIFKISTAGAFTVIKHLTGAAEGGNPTGTLIQATDGQFYGLNTNASGGFNGTIFKITSTGTMTVLKKFTLATDGGYPAGSLFQHTDGALYGLTTQGGQNFSGTLFKITTAAVYSVLAHFNGAHHGNTPYEQLTAGKDSAFYGVTNKGGLYNYGTIFKICGGTTTVLRHFNKATDGANPAGSLLQANDGNLYGTTPTGGTNGSGTIFKITRTGTFTVLRHLKATTDGGAPLGPLTQGTDGLIYGMNSQGGTGNAGTIFKISTAGVYTVLRHLVLSTDGGAPEGGLVQARDGLFYGITSSSSRFFKITTTGTFTVLATLASSTQGNGFSGALVQGAGTDNNLYGVTNTGGTGYFGTIIKLTTAGAVTVLRQLTAADGYSPRGSLVRASDGNYYGMNSAGGTNKAGSIFRITTAGVYTVIRHLNINTDGAASTGGLTLAPKRNLVATPQSNIAVTEDIAKAVVLAGTGSTALVYNIAVQPKNGTLTGTGKNRTYTPTTNYVGRDSFAFTVGVGCMVSNPAYVSFNVSGVNDAPVLATIGNKTAKRGTALTFTATATDPDAGQTKTFSLITPPSGATINATTGVFTWTPSTTGTFTVKVRVTDNGSPVLYDEETITITVAATLAASASLDDETASSLRYAASEGIYPNPTDRFATITLAEPFEKASSAVVDLKGAVMAQNKHRVIGENKIYIDLGSVLPGEYIIRVSTENTSKSFKVIKK